QAIEDAQKMAKEARQALEAISNSGGNVGAEAKQLEADQKEAAKDSLTEALAEKQIERGNLVERVNVMLAAYEAKGGDASPHYMYVNEVSGITIDVSDASGTMTLLNTWMRSEDGGMKYLSIAGKFLMILLAFWVFAMLAGRLISRAVEMSSKISNLLAQFINKSIRRVIMGIGLVVALSALGVDIGPLLAAIGAIGFVVAFALQDSLSNFASGLMILLYRPFDAGDIVEAGGAEGKVESTSLFSTHIRTPDNKAIVVPNNEIWGGVITNETHFPERRVDFVFSIGYSDDIEKTQRVLEQIVDTNQQILKHPAPVVRVHELGDSSVNFVCRVWLKTDNYWKNYWSAYWDLNHRVKMEFDANDISIPFPQQDVHLYKVDG
ncbi:MAG: mechanosensitive ion channel domain-containing protein, partial [Planctomycetota bacterium]